MRLNPCSMKNASLLFMLLASSAVSSFAAGSPGADTGKCSPGEHSTLQGAVNRECKPGSSKPRKCAVKANPDAALCRQWRMTSAERWSCYKAREAINKKCFEGLASPTEAQKKKQRDHKAEQGIAKQQAGECDNFVKRYCKH